MSDTFFEDISKYQAVVDTSYPFPVLSFRADSGWSTDINCVKNWAALRANPHIKMGLAYVVYMPGQNAAIMARLRAVFGPECPSNLAFMIDMESGSGFAGPGNHSTEASELAELLAIYAGNRARVCGYANTGDWAGSWPSHPSWLKRIVAKYSATPPSIPYYGWQYSDGDTRWSVPSGYPRTKTDMNVIHKPIDQILTDFAIGTAATPPPTPDTPVTTQEVEMLDPKDPVVLALQKQVSDLRALFGFDTDDADTKPNFTGTVQGIVAAELAPLKAELAAIVKKLGA